VIGGYSVRLDWSGEDEVYVATSPEFPGLSGVDEDANLALVELREAMEMALEIYEDEGRAPPKRKVINEYSGQFRLRVPKALHAVLANQADQEGCSLNTYVATLLAFRSGQVRTHTQVASELRNLLDQIRQDIVSHTRDAITAGSATASHPLEDYPLLALTSKTANQQSWPS
jgi:predicted HicB family RNase H-like nuclease